MPDPGIIMFSQSFMSNELVSIQSISVHKRGQLRQRQRQGGCGVEYHRAMVRVQVLYSYLVVYQVALET